MAQPFNCICGTETCRGQISGARDMTDAQLSGMWLNKHIRELLEERRAKAATAASATVPTNCHAAPPAINAKMAMSENDLVTAPLEVLDSTAQALRDAIQHAEKALDAARQALVMYVQTVRPHQPGGSETQGCPSAHGSASGISGVSTDSDAAGTVQGALRRGPTSRELSGEMGGDTSV